MQEDVVRLAAANMDAWGLQHRFKIVRGDITTPPSEMGDDFDLVTLYNNVYYFPVEERIDLFRGIGRLLRRGGKFALLSSMQGSTPLSADFDLILRSTVGCAPLPRLDELKEQLSQAGFADVKVARLVPLEPFYGLEARLQ
jgi:SAM-dependent methyltransferase